MIWICENTCISEVERKDLFNGFILDYISSKCKHLVGIMGVIYSHFSYFFHTSTSFLLLLILEMLKVLYLSMQK